MSNRFCIESDFLKLHDQGLYFFKAKSYYYSTQYAIGKYFSSILISIIFKKSQIGNQSCKLSLILKSIICLRKRQFYVKTFQSSVFGLNMKLLDQVGRQVPLLKKIASSFVFEYSIYGQAKNHTLRRIYAFRLRVFCQNSKHRFQLDCFCYILFCQ